MHSISILIATKNRSYLLSQCLNSLVKTGAFGCEIIIINNDSEDATETVIQEFTKILPIRSFFSVASGYPTVYNFGIRQCRNEYIIFLDDDCTVSSDWFNAVKRAININPNAVIQGKTLSLPLGNIFAEMMGDHYQNWIESHIITNNHLDCFDNKNLIIPRKQLTRSGLYNESLHGGSEDIELSSRLLHLGVQILYKKSILVFHHERVTLSGFVSQHKRIARSEAFLDMHGYTKKPIGITSAKRIKLYIKSGLSREINYVLQFRPIDVLLLPLLYIVLALNRVWWYGITLLNSKSINIK